MNERIKELAEQANEVFYQRMGIGAEKGTFYFDGFAEKFAELIVRECAVELMKLGNSYSECETDTDYMQGMLDSADIIKEHFGVDR